MVERKYFHDLFGGEAEAGSIAESVILVNDPMSVEPLSADLEDRKSVADHYEFRVITGAWKGLTVTVCSTGIGGGSTAIAVDNLVRLGAKTLLYADAGITGPDDQGVYAAAGAIRDDGASLDYARPDFPAAADPELLMAVLAAGRDSGTAVRPALLWASAGPLTAENDQVYRSYNSNLAASGRDFTVPIIVTQPEIAMVLTLGTIYRLRTGAVYAGAGSGGELGGAARRTFKLALDALLQLNEWDRQKAQIGWKVMTPAVPKK